MNKLSNLALLAQMLESAEKNIQSSRQLLREIMGSKSSVQSITDKAKTMTDPTAGETEGGRVIEGVFDGQNMIGPDGKQYPIPVNYASKSKLVEGDVLKLTIADDGSFIYKQIGPVDRVKKLGVLTQEENGEQRVIVDGKAYRVLLASLTYFKAEPGDEVTIIVPEEGDAEWAAVENVIKKGESAPVDPDSPARSGFGDDDIDKDLDLGDEDEEDEGGSDESEAAEEDSSEDASDSEASPAAVI